LKLAAGLREAAEARHREEHPQAGEVIHCFAVYAKVFPSYMPVSEAAAKVLCAHAALQRDFRTANFKRTLR
jgi:hypothetical protein